MHREFPSSVLVLTADDCAVLRAALRKYLRQSLHHAVDDASGAHSPENLRTLRHRVGQLLWQLETPPSESDDRVQYSSEAVDPDGVAVGDDYVVGWHGGWSRAPAQPAVVEDSLEPTHGFLVEPRIDGRWVTGYRDVADPPELYRGRCTCGWVGRGIGIDSHSFEPLTEDREAAYANWRAVHAIRG